MAERIYQPVPGFLLYNNMIANIEQGQIKIPQFQRKFVWSIEETASLIDSVLKGYPIGTFIIWKTQERLRSIRNLGGLVFPETPSGDMVQYVLDGQQRMTSLYVALKGCEISDDDGKVIDYKNIYVDLSANYDEPIVVTEIDENDHSHFIRLVDILEADMEFIFDNYDNRDFRKKIQQYKTAIQTYQFSTINVENAPIDVATEIFTRINVKGKTLSVFDIMVAKTYNAERNFDLSEKYDDLIDRLQDVQYDTIPNSTVLQAVSVCMVKDCTKKRILQLDRTAFIDSWDTVVDALERAVDYFKTFYRIPVSQLLPYDALLIPFTYYFYHHKEKPLGEQQRMLQDLFWRIVLSSRYSSSLEHKVGQDIRRVDDILAEKRPHYEEAVDVSAEYLKTKGWFSAGTAFVKGILCLLAYQQPLSFIDNSVVTINNAWLKQANSKNYHHFFPRAYMRNKQPDIEDGLVNHIANITIVDDFLNKRKIRDRAPSVYIAEFSSENPELKEALATHLIGDPDEWGINTNDYMTFFNKRLELYSSELRKRLILTEAN